MKKALLVIDVQNEYFTGKLKVTYPNNSFDNILKVMDYAKENTTGTIDVNNEVGSISSKDLHKATLIAQSLKFSNVISTMEWMKLSNI